MLRVSFQSVIRLNHSSVLPVKSFNVHKGYPFVVMSFMDAGSLDDRIEFGALGAMNPLAVLRETATALEATHSRGIIHGDLKPSNILFDEDGIVKLSGIGEAPLASVRANLLRDERPGRMSYQAPEVLAGGQVTPACDQYSLGLIALEMQTCLPVDEALNALQYIQRYGRDTVTRPSPYALDLSSKMIQFLSRSLSNDPNERFASMREWKQAFTAAYSNESIVSELEPEDGPEQITQEKPRRKRLVLFAPMLALILCLVVVVPALTSEGGGPLEGVLTSIGLIKEQSTQLAPAVDVSNVSIELATSTPEEKDASLGGAPVKAADSPALEDKPTTEGGGSDKPANTSVPPAKTDTTRKPSSNDPPPDEATPTITQTPTPTMTGEVTETATETPTEDVTEDPTETATLVPPTSTQKGKCKLDVPPDHPRACPPTPTSSP
jgi:serine/threonine-protein kinase